MARQVLVFAAAAVLAACGSKSPAPTTPAEPDPAAHHEHEAEGSAAATTETPTEPEKPEEPAPPKADPKAELLAAETAAWETAKPVFEKACATCHTSGGRKASKKKLDHFNFDSYPPGGHHTSTIGFTIRDVLGISGKKPTMPYDKPGSVQSEDLAKIKAWIDAWDAAEKGGAHPAAADHEHHH